MNPFETAPIRKPRQLNAPSAFPFLLTLAVAASLLTLLFAQAMLRAANHDDKTTTTLPAPHATSAMKQPRQAAVPCLNPSFFEANTVSFTPKP